jgi:hypothetical protein
LKPAKGKCLIITQQDGSVSSAHARDAFSGSPPTSPRGPAPPADPSKKKDPYPTDEEYPLVCYGIYGFVQLLSGLHLIVVRQRSLVGRLEGHAIYRIDYVQVVCVTPPIELRCVCVLSFASHSVNTAFFYIQTRAYTLSLSLSHAHERMYLFYCRLSTSTKKKQIRISFFWLFIGNRSVHHHPSTLSSLSAHVSYSFVLFLVFLFRLVVVAAVMTSARTRETFSKILFKCSAAIFIVLIRWTSQTPSNVVETVQKFQTIQQRSGNGCVA